MSFKDLTSRPSDHNPHKSNPRLDYWLECLQQSAEEHGAEISEEHAKLIAADIQGGHENYDTVFYSPPSSDRLNEIERQWKTCFDELNREYEAYRKSAETAVKQALRQPKDSIVSIGAHGRVHRHDGRTEVIQ